MQKDSPIEIINQRLHDDVQKHGKVQNFSKGDTIYSPDEMREKFFFVVSGRIKVYQINFADAREQTLKILATSDMYDPISLLDQKIHDNLLEALDDVKIIVFPVKIVREWMVRDNQFNQLIFPYIAKQFREMEELALDLSFYDTSQRLLKLISKSIDTKAKGQPDLIHDLSHEELASLIGTVRKVLNRHIQQLKKDGIISVKRKNIEIADTKKLLDSLPLF